MIASRTRGVNFKWSVAHPRTTQAAGHEDGLLGFSIAAKRSANTAGGPALRAYMLTLIANLPGQADTSPPTIGN